MDVMRPFYTSFRHLGPAVVEFMHPFHTSLRHNYEPKCLISPAAVDLYVTTAYLVASYEFS